MLPPQGPDRMSQHSDLEEKIRYEEEHPRQIVESEGNTRKTTTIGIAALVIVVAVPVCWIIFANR